MKRIYDVDSGSPSVKNVKHLPQPGRYRAMIYDVQTRVTEPFNKEEEFCMIVSYKIINTKTSELFDFVETYNASDVQSRIADFAAFLESHGCSTISDDKIVGITADVDIVNEYIGGFMHPVISYRQWGINKALQSYGDESRSIY